MGRARYGMSWLVVLPLAPLLINQALHQVPFVLNTYYCSHHRYWLQLQWYSMWFQLRSILIHSSWCLSSTIITHIKNSIKNGREVITPYCASLVLHPLLPGDCFWHWTWLEKHCWFGPPPKQYWGCCACAVLTAASPTDATATIINARNIALLFIAHCWTGY
jgi:hypothetical protein